MAAGLVAAALALPVFYGGLAGGRNHQPGWMSPQAALAQGQPQTQQDQDAQAAELERLRMEVSRLTRENQRLQEDLRNARLRIVDLEEQLAAGVRNNSGGGGAGGPGNAGPGGGQAGGPDQIVIPDSGQHPLASPEAVLTWLRDEYQQAMGGLNYGTERDEVRYMRTLRAWAARADTKYRGRFEWAAELAETEPIVPGEAAVIRIIIRDPATGEPWSRPFDLTLTERLEERFSRMSLKPGDAVMLKGTFRTEVKVDENREDVAAFETAALIGPFAEFTWEAELQSIAPAPEPVVEAWQQARDAQPQQQQQQGGGNGGGMTGPTGGGN